MINANDIRLDDINKRKNTSGSRTANDIKFNNTSDSRVALGIKGAKEEQSIDAKVAQKYNDYGLNWNPNENMDALLADAQSNWTKAGNALVQTASNLGIDIIKGFSDIANVAFERVPGLNAAHDADWNYAEKATNYVSDKLQEAKDYVNEEVAPIYTNPDVDILNGGLTDVGWWAKGLPNIVSSLSLLIPSKLVTTGLGKLAGAANASKYLAKGRMAATKLAGAPSKAKRWLQNTEKAEDALELNKVQQFINNPVNIARFNRGVDDIATATVSRAIENYQEAKDTKRQMYDEASAKFNEMSDEEWNSWVNANKGMFAEDNIDVTDKDAVAKAIAQKAADRTFSMDWSNMIFDVIQLHGLRNIGKGIKKAEGAAVERSERESRKAAKEWAEQRKEAKVKAKTKQEEGKTSATGENKTAEEKVTEAQEAKPNKAEKSVAAPGKAARKINEESTKRKLYNFVKDYAKGEAKMLLEESTEGIEEGINYIASQEGITYGKALLEGKDDKATDLFSAWNNLQNPLEDYLSDPEFYENAFWGVFGGFVFAGAGNKINQYKLYQYRKAAEESRKTNDKTGESVKTSNDNGGISHFIDLLEMPEQKAARISIQKRQARMEQFAADRDAIMSGKDIYAERNADGSYKDFTGDVELKQQLALDNLYSNFTQEVALDALNSGTFDGLLDYYKDENVREALKQSGIISENATQEEVDRVVADLTKVKDLYYKESAHVLNQMTNINAQDDKEDVPLDYLQHIAHKNVNYQLAIDNLQRKIDSLGNKISTLEQDERTANPKRDLNSDKEAIRLGMLTDLYGRNAATIRAIEEDKSMDNWEKKSQLKMLKKQQEFIIDELKQSTINGTAMAPSAIFTALRYGNAYERKVTTSEDGKTKTASFELNKEKFKESDEAILKQTKDLLGAEIGEVSDETIIQMAKKMRQNIRNVNGTDNADGSLYNTNRALYDSYLNQASLELQKQEFKNKLARTTQDVMDEVDLLHNSLNKARQVKVQLAEKTIRQLYDKYKGIKTADGRAIEDAVLEAYGRNKVEARKIAEEVLEDDDVETFMDALDIFNFGAKANDEIYNYIASIFTYNKHKDNQNGEESTTSENASESTEKSSVNDNSADGFKSADSVSMESVEALKKKSTPTTTAKTSKRNVTINFNRKGELASIKPKRKGDNTYALLDRGDGTYEIDVMSLPKAKQHELINGGFFEGDIDLISDDWNITSNPVIEPTKSGKSYSLVSKGVVEKVGEEAEEGAPMGSVTTPIEESNDGETVETQTTSSTGEVTEDNNTTTPVPTPATTPEPAPATTPTTTPKSAVNPMADVIREVKATVATKVSDSILSKGLELDSKDLDLDAIASEVEASLDANGKQVLNEVINEFKEQRRVLQEINDNLSKTGAGLAFASRFVDPANPQDFNPFAAAVEAFMKEYEKISIVKEIDGKKVVKLSDILRICNRSYGTAGTSVASAMYDVVRNYLLSKEGANKYIVLDAAQGENVIQYADKSDEEIMEELDKEDSANAFRIDILHMEEAAEMSGRGKEWIEAYNLLQLGNSMTVSQNRNSDGSGEMLFRFNNVTIGRVPYPTVVGNGYETVNEGWFYDLSKDSAGNTVGGIVDFVTYALLGDTKDHNDLKVILTKAQLTDTSSPQYKQLVREFSDNPIIIDAVKKSLATKRGPIFIDNEGNIKGTNEQIFNHLVKLWKYSNSTPTSYNSRSSKQLLKNTLTRWFDNLYDQYDLITTSTPDQIVAKVEQITDGSLSSKHNETGSIAEHLEMSFADEVIDDIDNAKIGYVTSTAKSQIQLDGETVPIDLPRYSSKNLLLSINAPHGGLYVTEAAALENDDLRRNPFLKEVSEAAVEELYNILYGILNNGDDTSRIKELFLSLFATNSGNNNNRVGLYRANPKLRIKVEDGKNKLGNFVKITITDNNGNYVEEFEIYTQFNGTNSIAHRPHRGVNCIGYDRSNLYGSAARMISDMMEAVAPHVCVNANDYKCINEGHLDNTNNKGFINRKNGEFVFKFGKVERHYKSFSEFLIKEKLLKCDLKKDKNGKNFVGRSNKQILNRNLYVSLHKEQQATTNQHTTNVTTSNPNKPDTLTDSANNFIQTERLTDSETAENLVKIMNDSQTVSGIDIIREILPTDDAARLTEAMEEFGVLNELLPSKLFYEPEINQYVEEENGYRGAIAYSNPGNRPNHQVFDENGNPINKYLGKGKTAVGPAWLSLATSANKHNRKQAIQKLIHEQLHIKLHQNEKKAKDFLEKMKDITDYVEKCIEKDKKDYVKFPEGSDARKKLMYVANTLYDYKKYGDTRSEELLVESLTSQSTFDYLNSLEYDEANDNGKKDTVITRIFKALAKFLGWNVNDGSVIMKELNLIRDLLGDDDVTTPVEENVGSSSDTFEKDDTSEKDEKDEPAKDEPENDKTPKKDEAEDYGFGDEADEYGLNDAYDEFKNEKDEVEEPLDEEDEDDDLLSDSTASRYLEPEYKDGYRPVNDIEAFGNKLPLDLQRQYQKAIDNGTIEIKCSIK